ncbi:MAG: type II secretion system protein [Candidatus Cloacimonetes bacterium]|nr:type II secretion system protein [Candidatus Cloacimonadota bacterium]
MNNQKGFSVYTVISIIGIIALAFILVLPQMFSLDKKENTEQCIRNMKSIRDAVSKYFEIAQKDFVGDIDDLDRQVGLKVSMECPANGVGDKYYVHGNYETGEIIVTCPHAEKAEYSDHKLITNQ